MSAKMNNFSSAATTTETLPKSGHVNEVCKEWLVREDGALAYKLQSQEITDFYKGNRTRNAVVREDFPTALQEQLKEKETAEKQAEAYRRRLKEQEEYDKRVAKEITDKLERDLQEQRLRELESEKLAQDMQAIYVNLPPALPPPSARDKNKVPPPRPAKSSTLLQSNQQPISPPNGYRNPNSPQFPIQLQQHHFSNADGGYVGLSLHATPAQLQQHHRSPTNSHNHNLNHNNLVVGGDSQGSATQLMQQHHHQQQPPANQSPCSSSSPSFSYRQGGVVDSSSPLNSLSSSSSASRRHVLESQLNMNTSYQQQLPPPLTPTSPHTPLTPTHAFAHTPPPPSTTTTAIATPPTHQHPDVEELIEYSDVADSIRRYDMNKSSTDTLDSHKSHNSASSSSPAHSHSHSHHHHNHHMHNASKISINRLMSPSHENLLKNDHKFQKLSPEKYDCLVGNATPNQTPSTGVKERHLQEHADDIELYVDPCDYKEIGLPMAEIKEMNAKLKQEQKDELLARRLQELEVQDGMTLEERDRMLAIEAQDKELAKMLQEREKAKAKRAKEKARQRKSQQAKEPTTMPHSQPLPSANGHLPLMAHENGMLTSNSSSSRHSQLSAIEGQQYHADHEDPLDLDAYSNPIDVLKHSQQRTQNGCLTNGSLQRDLVSQQARHASLAREDDIYTLPVDSCRPGHSVANNSNSNLRPASMNVCAENGLTVGGAGVGAYSQNSMTRSENFSIHSHDSMNSRHSSNSKTQAFDQNSSPTPPYMPIQGTRRSNSSEDRKKKSKDNKCTHQ
uniref:Coiled-coil domain-containing protein n=1 Tax=Stomoxys calcitrans TaxID=35570 RepID=A0A1I8PUN0_STOCA